MMATVFALFLLIAAIGILYNVFSKQLRQQRERIRVSQAAGLEEYERIRYVFMSMATNTNWQNFYRYCVSIIRHDLYNTRYVVIHAHTSAPKLEIVRRARGTQDAMQSESISIRQFFPEGISKTAAQAFILWLVKNSPYFVYHARGATHLPFAPMLPSARSIETKDLKYLMTRQYLRRSLDSELIPPLFDYNNPHIAYLARHPVRKR